MEKDLPLKIETLPKTQGEKLSVTSFNEIMFVLNYIAEKGNRVALYYNQENHSILTTLLAVDKTGLWLEQGLNKSANKNLIESKNLIFVSSHLQIKVQFTFNQASNVIYKGHPAFYIPLPNSIYRFQRREYYRLSTPILNPLHCKVTFATSPISTREFVILDISGGGVGLSCTGGDNGLTPNQSHLTFRITLPNTGEISGTLEVKNLVELNSPTGRIIKRAGCEFKTLDGSSRILLQRYVTIMQRTLSKSL